MNERGSAMLEAEATAEMFLIPGPSKTAIPAEPSSSPEALLVKAVLAGNRDSFGRLYELYAPMVHGILLARVPRTEVEDLVQDIFLHAFKKLTTLRDANAFGGWLAMITRNRAMDFHRSSKPTVEVREEHATGDRRKRAKAEEILTVIRSLPDAYRETLVLRLVEGMTGPEIAMRTGLTAASVRVNLHRGMKLLREKLGIQVAEPQS
ncbi:MAG TPA: sigma-70 family RNA polymerase sigma factor [Pyrinomonadaceae bacterium]|nr:sigma-70 family RNA polymerase sigma factor [Pyrinomonadaceae bacterium]